MKARLLAVCPYEALRDLVQSVASTRDDVVVDTILGDISDGESLGKRVRAMQDSYDLLLSRGQTLQFLCNYVSIPSLEISPSPFDIMRIVRLIKDFPGRCVIVGTTNVYGISQQICKLMEANVETIASNSNDDIFASLQRLKEEGCSLVIGGITGVRMARSLGMNSLLITSGREAVSSVLDNAAFLFAQLERSNLEAQLLRTLVNSEKCYTVIFDSQRQKIFQSTNPFVLPLPSIVKKLDALFQCGELSTHIRIDGGVYIFNGRLCEVGREVYALVRITPCYYVEPKKQSWLTVQSASDAQPLLSIVTNTQNPALLRMMEQMNSYAISKRPVIVRGENGTGKEAIVQKLHALSRNRNNDLIIIDAAMGTKKSWDALLNHPNSPLNRMDCSIFFKNIQEIPDYICEPFEDYIRHIAASESVRLYFSWTEIPERPMEKHRFWRFMSEKQSALSLWMPPLRERIEDLPNLVTLLISESNVELGAQVFGIEEQAVRLLQSYSWPHNFRQLRQCIRDAVMKSWNKRISAVAIQDLLAQFPQAPSAGAQVPIRLDRTLAEINEEIIQYALREENYNYTRTAARLGISRSSLWRKIRQ